jgi:hypothetical protein
MIDSQVPQFLWGDAANTAVHLHQRTPNDGLTKSDDRDGYQHHIQHHTRCCKDLASLLKTMMEMKSRTQLLSTTFGDSAATPVELSPSRNAMENSAQNPSHV